MSQVLCVCLSVKSALHCCGFDLPEQATESSALQCVAGATVVLVTLVATQVITMMTTPRNAARGTDCAPCDGVLCDVV